MRTPGGALCSGCARVCAVVRACTGGVRKLGARALRLSLAGLAGLAAGGLTGLAGGSMDGQPSLAGGPAYGHGSRAAHLVPDCATVLCGGACRSAIVPEQRAPAQSMQSNEPGTGGVCVHANAP